MLFEPAESLTGDIAYVRDGDGFGGRRIGQIFKKILNEDGAFNNRTLCK